MSEGYKLRAATEADIQAIMQINHAYFPLDGESVQNNIEEVLLKRKQGFLLSKYSEQDVKEMWKNTLVVEFYRARFRQVMPDEELLKLLVWENSDASLQTAILGDQKNPASVHPDFADSPLAKYDVILQNENCVAPEYLGKGVATFALKKMWDNPSLILSPDGTTAEISPLGSLFYCYIVSSPYNNEPSIKFSEKLGYKREGKFSKDEYADLKNYGSLLYIKKVDRK